MVFDAHSIKRFDWTTPPPTSSTTQHAERPDFVLAGDLNFRGGSESYKAFAQKIAELGFGKDR